jgi:hypothetical protein
MMAALKRRRGGKRLLIQWSFLAHHFRHDLGNWKRFNKSGGGAIRFYGIQLIALLAEMGYQTVVSSRGFGNSPEEIDKWIASFSGPELPECDVALDARSVTEKFSAELLFNRIPEAIFADLRVPFESSTGGESSEGLDRRVHALSRLCRSLWEQIGDEDVWYKATIELWRSVEERTSFEQVGQND